MAPELLENFQKQILHEPVKKVYDNMLKESTNVFSAPRNLAGSSPMTKIFGKNYGDEVLQIISMA